jgi:flavin-dependent dehydrogenase
METLKQNYDLVVVGAGPAGCAAAISAARGGVRVLLLERGRFPRHKVCGEFVSAESLGLLESLLAPTFHPLLHDALRIDKGRLFLEGRVLPVPIQPPAASIARFDLDEALFHSATAMGVATQLQSTVLSISGFGPFWVQTAAGNLEAGQVINAAGRWSNLTTRVPPTHEKWLGIKAHFAENAPPLSVDLYFFEGGYCGVQPVQLRSANPNDGRINLAAMVRADIASSLSEVLSLHTQLKERSRTWQLLTEPVTTSPLFFREPQPLREGILNVGDAAAFVDPFVGDGISLALRSGSLAGELVASGCADRYPGEYRKRFGSVFRNSSQLRRLLRMPRRLRRPMVAVLAHTPAITEYFVTRTR